MKRYLTTTLHGITTQKKNLNLHHHKNLKSQIGECACHRRRRHHHLLSQVFSPSTSPLEPTVHPTLLAHSLLVQ